MPRKARVDRRRIAPDPVYASELVEKFINAMMWDGKMATAARAFYTAMDIVKQKSNDDPLKIFQRAVENSKPLLEVKTRRDVIEGDPPQAAVHTRKQNRLAKLAHGYLKLKRIRQTPCRFDVVSVIINDEGGVKAIRHIPNAFSVAPW